MKTMVRHWRFENGNTCPNPTMPEGKGRLDPPPRGWYCWAYPKDWEQYQIMLRMVDNGQN